MMKVIQCNTNRCRLAHDLLEQTLATRGIDVGIISEPNRARVTGGTWITDDRHDAAIWLSQSARERQVAAGTGSGYVWVDLGVAVIYSCYISPNVPQTVFESFLDQLEDNVAKWSAQRLLVVAGDFNATAAEWGSKTTDRRGMELLEMAGRRGLGLLNDGEKPTFRRREQEAFLDLTFYSENVGNHVEGWRVLEEETSSDHLYVEFLVQGANTTTAAHSPNKPNWNAKKLNLEIARQTITRECEAGEKGDSADGVSRILEEACRTATTKTHPKRRHRQPMYWWTPEIAEARRRCVALHRKHQRATKPLRDERAANEALSHYRDSRKVLRRLIQRSKQRCWLALCDEVERNPFGKAYLIVMKKMGMAAPKLAPDLLDKVVAHLFPQRPVQNWDLTPNVGPESNARHDGHPVTEEEVLQIARDITTGKAPGIDGVPPEVTKILLEERPDIFAAMANGLFRQGIFPKRWKIARLVLIPKPGKPLDSPSAYRPLCLLNTIGKAVEMVLVRRLAKELEENGTLADSQYGFRTGKSTVDAIEKLVNMAEEERAKPYESRQFCLAIMLDVRNAFNSMPWEIIMKALQEAGISLYLQRMIGSYLQDRQIQMADGRSYPMTAGVPQGSILGPTLWNVAYNGVLGIQMPEGVQMVAYADDLALVVKAKGEEVLQSRANEALERVQRWMGDRNLELAPEKTEAILLTGRKVCQPLEKLTLQGHRIQTSRQVKYLGVLLDQSLTFSPHVRYATNKARKVAQNLSRLMPRMRGAGDARRQLLATVASSVVLYASPVWKQALARRCNRDQLRRVQRLTAIRVSRAYRTVSTPAALVLAGLIPWHLLVEERAEGHAIRKQRIREAADRSQCAGRHSTFKERRAETMAKWQEEWGQEQEVGRWTRKLIPDLRVWQTRKAGQLTYHLTQALSGHGCFGEYLFKKNKAKDARCALCESGANDDAEHTLFRCGFFASERARLTDRTHWSISPGELTGKMLENEDQWRLITEYIEAVLKKKRAQLPTAETVGVTV